MITTEPLGDTRKKPRRTGRRSGVSGACVGRGTALVFSSSRGGSASLYRRNADGTGEAETLITDGDAYSLRPTAWTPARDALVVTRVRNNRRADLTLLSEQRVPVP